MEKENPELPMANGGKLGHAFHYYDVYDETTTKNRKKNKHVRWTLAANKRTR